MLVLQQVWHQPCVDDVGHVLQHLLCRVDLALQVATCAVIITITIITAEVVGECSHEFSELVIATITTIGCCSIVGSGIG